MAAAWPEAVARWPELPDLWGAHDYPSYCAELEAHLAQFAASTGAAPLLARIDIEAYLAWCEQDGRDPSESGSRVGYAAELARTGTS